MRKTVLLVLLLFTTIYHTTAQVGEPNLDDSWRKRLEIAEEQEKLGNFSAATSYYLSVFQEKTKRTDLAYKVGELGMKARKYKDVVTAMRAIKGDKKFPKSEYYLGMALKGLGQYSEAAKAFDSFSDSYRGADYQLMTDLATQEMDGCVLGNDMKTQKNIRMNYLSKIVNSPKKEFAPIPFGEDILYYSSNAKSATKIFRTEKLDRTWKEPLEPNIFGAMEKEHFCGGSFTPNKQRFYFTQCDIVNGEYQCEIYVMHRLTGGKWSPKPQKLPDYINKEGYTATDPYVCVEGGQEILYFSSDREGGVGGKDIWFATKDYDSQDLNFDIPVNLGETVNTVGDEVSPFYENANRVLYFSSNGHTSIGGFDVFKSEGSQEEWKSVENLGMPINSSGDDTYYVMNADLVSGFVSSNRMYGTEKTVTDNDDLFMFTIKEPEVSLEGRIHEEGNPSKSVQNVMVSLYEVTNSGEYALGSNITPDGYYSFVVQQNRKYKIQLEVTGYENASYPIDMRDFNGQSSISKDLAMKSKFDEDVREDVPGVDKPIIDVVEVDTKPDEDDRNPPGMNPTIKPPGSKTDVINKIETTDIDEIPQRELPITADVIDEEEEQIPPKPNFEIEEEEEELPRVDQDGNPIILATRYRSDLTRGQMQTTIMVDNQEYLPVEGGYWKILTPEVDSDFPGIDGGLGQHFRIQLAAVSTYKEYKFTAALDALEGSEIVRETATSREGKEVERVMLTSFRNFEEAKRALRTLRAEGYDRAFIIRYENDRRKGRMIRNID